MISVENYRLENTAGCKGLSLFSVNCNSHSKVIRQNRTQLTNFHEKKLMRRYGNKKGFFDVKL